MKAGAAKKIRQTTGNALAGAAIPVVIQVSPGTILAGAAIPVQVVNAAYVAAHGLQAGEPIQVYEVATGKITAGTVIPVYEVS